MKRRLQHLRRSLLLLLRKETTLMEGCFEAFTSLGTWLWGSYPTQTALIPVRTVTPSQFQRISRS